MEAVSVEVADKAVSTDDHHLTTTPQTIIIEQQNLSDHDAKNTGNGEDEEEQQQPQQQQQQQKKQHERTIAETHPLADVDNSEPILPQSISISTNTPEYFQVARLEAVLTTLLENKFAAIKSTLNNAKAKQKKFYSPTRIKHIRVPNKLQRILSSSTMASSSQNMGGAPTTIILGNSDGGAPVTGQIQFYEPGNQHRPYFENFQQNHLHNHQRYHISSRKQYKRKKYTDSENEYDVATSSPGHRRRHKKRKRGRSQTRRSASRHGSPRTHHRTRHHHHHHRHRHHQRHRHHTNNEHDNCDNCQQFESINPDGAPEDASHYVNGDDDGVDEDDEPIEIIHHQSAEIEMLCTCNAAMVAQGINSDTGASGAMTQGDGVIYDDNMAPIVDRSCCLLSTSSARPNGTGQFQYHYDDDTSYINHYYHHGTDADVGDFNGAIDDEAIVPQEMISPQQVRRKHRSRRKKRRRKHHHHHHHRHRRYPHSMFGAAALDDRADAEPVVKTIDPDDLPQRARWTIIATAFLLLIMCLLLVGVTLRMAPIIDEMDEETMDVTVDLTTEDTCEEDSDRESN